MSEQTPCPLCGGSGFADDALCRRCLGAGVVTLAPGERTVYGMEGGAQDRTDLVTGERPILRDPQDPHAGQRLKDGLPERPYRQDGEPSAGWSGTDTSRDSEPVRAASQRTVLAFVRSQGRRGATVIEVREDTGLHHGIASGALTVLHKKGHLARLTAKRDKCRVYVTTDNVNGRDHD